MPDSAGQLTLGPGEPLLVMDQLCRADAGRAARRQPIFTFYHLTDSHHTDTGSGRSLEIARQFDPGDGELGRAYRQWAPFTGATLISAVRTLVLCAASPITGRPLDMLILGGDFINNSQLNELSSFVDIFGGRVARPFKRTFTPLGRRLNWEPAGQRCVSAMPPTLAQPGDRRRIVTLYSAGSNPMAGAHPLPYPAAFVLGNHDLKPLGHMTHGLLTTLWAMQPLKFMTRRPVQLEEIKAIHRGIYSKDAAKRHAAQRAIVKLAWRNRKELAIVWSGFDLGRRAVTVKKAWEALSPLLGSTPITRGGPAYYTLRPVPGLVLVMLDTTARGGSGEGQVEHEQFQWLEQQLALAERKQELVIVVSHHPSFKLIDPTPDPESNGPLHLSGDFIRLLLRSKAVVAHVAGHTHENRIVLRRDPRSPGRGYWEICTGSMIEWPQQFRFLELFRNGDGTLSLVTCMMNHLSAPEVGRIEVTRAAGKLPEDVTVYLASFARTLSYRDCLLGADSRAGLRAIGRHRDRNVELLLSDPYA